MDKNKSRYKLDNLPPVFWINLDRFPDRQKYMIQQFDYWGIENHTRISGVDGVEYEEHLKGMVPDNMNSGECACVMSHLGIPGWTEGSDSSPCALPLGTDVCTLSPFGWLALVPRSVCSCGRILLDLPHNM